MNTTITYNFTLVNETINNVAKNTFNDYKINNIMNIALICDNYELSMNFNAKSNLFTVFNANNIIYSHEIKNINDLINDVINEKTSIKFALNRAKSIMKQLITYYEFSINKLNNDISEYNVSNTIEYKLYSNIGKTLSSNCIYLFSNNSLNSVRKISIVSSNYTCIFKDDLMTLMHNDKKDTIKLFNANLMFKSVPALIEVIMNLINAIIDA